MRVLLATGIFPPDIGGPATHAADLKAELTARGQTVEVVSLGDAGALTNADGVVRFPRRWPWPVRNALLLGWLARRARRFDVVYATGLGAPAVAGARLAGRPVVLKIVGDPAWERATRRSLTSAGFDDFQHEAPRTMSVRAMRWVRSWTTRNATRVITPSDHLAGVVAEWSQRDDVEVIPNGVRFHHEGTPADRLDAGLRVVFVGRLVSWKRVDLLIRSLTLAPGVALTIVGDGPEADTLEQLARDERVADRVQFVGSLEHDEVMHHLGRADLFALASSYEGLPHVLIEALVSGTPIVATRDAGVVAVVSDGVNGLLVDASAEAFADAFVALAHDPAHLEDLRAGALDSGREWTFDRCADRIEAVLRAVSAPLPRAVFVGKSAVPVPLDADHRVKYAMHRRHIETTVVSSGARFTVTRADDARIITLPSDRPKLLSTPRFYALAPIVALRAACGRRPAAVSCQSPYEAVGVLALRPLIPARFRPRVQIEVHGDWRTATRLYGSPRRHRVSRVADGLAGWALRHADRVRVVSGWLDHLSREAGYRGPIDRFIAFSDYRSFYEPGPCPLGSVPAVAFVGMLERYKAVDVLIDAWPLVLVEVPDAQLAIVGAGTEEHALRSMITQRGLAESVTMRAPVPRTEIRRLLDRAWCLCLPSRSEGLGRVVVEAMAAGRAVVASRAGGPEELVDDGVTGRLVPTDDPAALATALVDVIGDRRTAARMGEAARRRAEAFDPAGDYEAGIERFSAWIAGS